MERPNVVPQVGSGNFNVNKLLYDRILDSDYTKALYQVHSFQEITDEVLRRVTHVEPWSAGTSRNPSTAWCLLVKYFVMKLTVKQVNSMIRRQGAPYVRALGFLYLRIVTEPKHLWDWCEEFIDDPEEFAPGANPDITMPMGKFVSKLLGDLHYYDTVLPRIPVPIERKMKAYMILLEDEHRRADGNMRLLHLLREGAKVQAIYKDDENDPAFYPATVQEVVEPDEEGRKPKVVVTFDEYGNTECLALGKVQLPDAVDPLIAKNEADAGADHDRGRGDRRRSRSRDRRRSRSRDREQDRDRDDRRRSRSRSRGREKRTPPPDAGGGGGGSLLASVMSKVTERDRDKSAATGKDYAQRPASYKGSLSLKLDRFTHRKRSRSRSPLASRGGGGGGGGGGGARGETQRERRDRDREDADRSGVYETSSRAPVDDSKSRYLKSRYGDASAS